MTTYIDKFRNDFPALRQKVHGFPLVYLDNAASTLKPERVIKAINQHYQKETANVHRGIHFLSSQGTQKYEKTRETIKDFIKAKSEKEIIFTKGTTEAINLVAHSWGEIGLSEGDEILISTMEHHSNIVPWQLIAARKKARVIEIPITTTGEIDKEAFKKLLNPRVKLVSMVHISNTLGSINPIEELIPLVHEIGALFMVDAAQSIAHCPIDVQKLNCDFMGFSSHKMYGPTGVGVLYGKEEHLNKMPPYEGGGAMISEVRFEGTSYNELPEKFEAGTPHIAGVIALKESIDYIKEIGFEAIEKKERQLLEEATQRLSSFKGLKIIGTAEHKASVISFIIEGTHPHDIGMILDQQGVAIRTGHHCTQPLMRRFDIPATARASFSFYNNAEDIDRLSSAIKKAKELL